MTCVAVALLVVGSVGPVSAQQPARPPGGGPAQPGAGQPMDPSMMQMCRQMMMEHHQDMGGGMMGRGMGRGMMGMMPMMGGDPKQQAEMMAMRGEMMKAMGDIMMKYAERMRPPK
jgi:hypothetical protein